ncbi:hypothetical protein MCGE09_00179 [Thaumarchaeota archaeon SCGC AB-539-E09]|nr:hypothetical protein MCGE09_00179 [Thaumarchaeota archaeon SCGC AB-539-E09]
MKSTQIYTNIVIRQKTPRVNKTPPISRINVDPPGSGEDGLDPPHPRVWPLRLRSGYGYPARTDEGKVMSKRKEIDERDTRIYSLIED